MNQQVSMSGSAELETDKRSALKLDTVEVFIVEGTVRKIGQESTATQGVRDVAKIQLGTIMRITGAEAMDLRERMAAWRAEQEGGDQLALDTTGREVEA